MAHPTGFVRAERIWLKGSPTFNEKWVQTQIAEDPAVLGLGELEVKDLERMQPRAGRLDMLLQDPETYRRYTVELQLGATDESHIIRTLEYWDIERKRYPQYDHCAVIVAEEVTSRFLNVISLFNGSVPLIAVQMAALRVGSAMTLTFTTVLGELERGLDEDDGTATSEVVDRAFWEAKGTPATVALADRVLELVRSFAPQLTLRFNKHYIGFAKDGQAFNFAICKPRRGDFLKVNIRLPKSEATEQALEGAGIALDYDKRWGAYRIRLTSADVEAHGPILTQILKAAFDARGV